MSAEEQESGKKPAMSRPLAEEVRRRNSRRNRPEWIAVKSFAVAILVGTFVLMLPVSSSTGQWTSPLTALFTSTSAVCVTGLIVVDTGSYYSIFGQAVIALLIQLGGLGIMTLGTLLLVLVGRRLSMGDELLLMDSLGAAKTYRLKSLLLNVILFTLIIECIGGGIMAWRFSTVHGMSLPRAVYTGGFHAISAFCNAGFSLFTTSLVDYRTDAWVVLTVAVQLILGGLGFLVLYNLATLRPWRRNLLQTGRLTLHTRNVLWITVLLLAVGWVAFALFEWNGTLKELPLLHKLTNAFFQSATPRTAGFNVVPMPAVSSPALFMTLILMFIGGAPGSTAGGIKITTALVLWLTVSSMLKGNMSISIGGRSVSPRIAREAITIFVLSVIWIGVAFLVLLMTEHISLLDSGPRGGFDALFETVSAFGTVGLSTGRTEHLSVAGRLIIIACMFVGRLGPMTMALVVGRKDVQKRVRYPEEEIFVG